MKLKKILDINRDVFSNPESAQDDYSLKSKFSCSGSGRLGRDFRLKDLETVMDSGHESESRPEEE